MVNRSLTITIIVLLYGSLGAISYGAEGNLSGTFLIAGNGPERHLLEILAREFEQLHPAVSIDFFWHPNAKPIRTVELHEADIGVTGEEEPNLRSTVVARDGIAILTNFSNPINEITTKQLSEVFSGKVKFWSQLHEEAPPTKIILVNRTTNQNIRQGFGKLLGIEGGIPRSAKMAGTEAQAINEVTGQLDAVTFVSMTPALRAKEDGIAVNLLFVNRVEPEYQTVLDGRYPLQRPVIFITRPDRSALVEAFEEFVLSDTGQQMVKKGKFYPVKNE